MRNQNNVSHRCRTPRLISFHSDSFVVKICCRTLSLCSISRNFTVLTLSNAFVFYKTLYIALINSLRLSKVIRESPSAHFLPSHDAMSHIDRNDRCEEVILSNYPLNPLISFPDRTSAHIGQSTQLQIETEQHPRVT